MKGAIVRHGWMLATCAVAAGVMTWIISAPRIEGAQSRKSIISPPVMLPLDHVERQVALRAFNGSARPAQVLLTLFQPGEAAGGQERPGTPGKLLLQQWFTLAPGQAAALEIKSHELQSGQVAGMVTPLAGAFDEVSAALDVREVGFDNRLYAYVPMRSGEGQLAPY